MICKIRNFLRIFFNRKKFVKFVKFFRMKKIRKIRILDLRLYSYTATHTMISYLLKIHLFNNLDLHVSVL